MEKHQTRLLNTPPSTSANVSDTITPITLTSTSMTTPTPQHNNTAAVDGELLFGSDDFPPLSAAISTTNNNMSSGSGSGSSKSHGRHKSRNRRSLPGEGTNFHPSASHTPISSNSPEMDRLHEANNALEMELKQTKTKLSTFQTQNKELFEIKETLEKTLDGLQQQISDRRNQSTGESELLRKKIQLLEEDQAANLIKIEELKMNDAKQKIELVELRLSLKNSKDEERLLANELSKADNQQEEYQQQIKQLKSKHEVQLKDRDMAFATITNEMVQLKEQFQELKNERNVLQTEIQQLRDKLQVTTEFGYQIPQSMFSPLRSSQWRHVPPRFHASPSAETPSLRLHPTSKATEALKSAPDMSSPPVRKTTNADSNSRVLPSGFSLQEELISPFQTPQRPPTTHSTSTICSPSTNQSPSRSPLTEQIASPSSKSIPEHVTPPPITSEQHFPPLGSADIVSPSSNTKFSGKKRTPSGNHHRSVSGKFNKKSTKQVFNLLDLQAEKSLQPNEATSSQAHAYDTSNQNDSLNLQTPSSEKPTDEIISDIPLNRSLVSDLEESEGANGNVDFIGRQEDLLSTPLSKRLHHLSHSPRFLSPMAPESIRFYLDALLSAHIHSESTPPRTMPLMMMKLLDEADHTTPIKPMEYTDNHTEDLVNGENKPATSHALHVFQRELSLATTWTKEIERSIQLLRQKNMEDSSDTTLTLDQTVEVPVDGGSASSSDLLQNQQFMSTGEFGEQSATMYERIAELTEQNEELRERNEELENKLEACETEFAVLRTEEYSHSQRKMSQKQEQSSDLRTEDVLTTLQQFRKGLSELHHPLTQLKTENESLRSTLESKLQVMNSTKKSSKRQDTRIPIDISAIEEISQKQQRMMMMIIELERMRSTLNALLDAESEALAKVGKSTLSVTEGSNHKQNEQIRYQSSTSKDSLILDSDSNQLQIVMEELKRFEELQSQFDLLSKRFNEALKEKELKIDTLQRKLKEFKVGQTKAYRNIAKKMNEMDNLDVEQQLEIRVEADSNAKQILLLTGSVADLKVKLKNGVDELENTRQEKQKLDETVLQCESTIAGLRDNAARFKVELEDMNAKHTEELHNTHKSFEKIISQIRTESSEIALQHSSESEKLRSTLSDLGNQLQVSHLEVDKMKNECEELKMALENELLLHKKERNEFLSTMEELKQNQGKHELEKSKHEEEIRILQIELATKTTELEAGKSAMNTETQLLVDDLQSTKASYQESIAIKNNLEERNTKYVQDLKDKDLELTKCLEALKDNESQFESMAQSVKAAEAKIDLLEEDLTQFRLKALSNEETANAFIIANQELLSCKLLLEDRSNTIAMLEQKLKNALKEMDEQHLSGVKEISQIQQQMKSYIQARALEFEDLKDTHKRQLNKQANEYQQVKEEVASRQQQAHDLNEQLVKMAEKASMVENLQEINAKLELDIATMAGQIDHLTEARSDLVAKLEALEMQRQNSTTPVHLETSTAVQPGIVKTMEPDTNREPSGIYPGQQTTEPIINHNDEVEYAAKWKQLLLEERNIWQAEKQDLENRLNGLQQNLDSLAETTTVTPDMTDVVSVVQQSVYQIQSILGSINTPGALKQLKAQTNIKDEISPAVNKRLFSVDDIDDVVEDEKANLLINKADINAASLLDRIENKQDHLYQSWKHSSQHFREKLAELEGTSRQWEDNWEKLQQLLTSEASNSALDQFSSISMPVPVLAVSPYELEVNHQLDRELQLLSELTSSEWSVEMS